jgi:hypothetical protein
MLLHPDSISSTLILVGYGVMHWSQSFCSPPSSTTATVYRCLVKSDLLHLFTNIRYRRVHNPGDRMSALSNCDHRLAHARLTLADSLTSTGALTHNDYLNVSALQLRHCAATGSCSNIIYKCDVTKRASTFLYNSPISV